MSERFEETATLRANTRRLLLTEKFRAALRGETKPENNRVPDQPHATLWELTRGTQKQKIVGRPGTSTPLPRAAYGTPRDVAPSHGAKHRSVRYMEDFAADGSGFSEVHDLVANGVSKVDVLETALLSRAGRDTVGLEDVRHDNRDPWKACEIASDTNNKRVVAYLEARGYDGGDVEHYHEAFRQLSAKGLLQVRAAKPTPRPAVNVRDLYNMPLEDLRKLAEQDERAPNSTRLVGRR